MRATATTATAPTGALQAGHRLRGASQWVLYSVPVLAFAVLGWAHRFTSDDGFIYFRVVREITSGHGPVFNPGQRVEAFTSPTWVALLAGLDVLTPIRLEWIATTLGIACSAAGLCFAMAGSALLVRRDAPDDFLLPFGVIVPVAVLPMWYWQTGGLETGLVFGWLGLSLWVLARWATSTTERLPRWGAVVLGLGWLIRPELIVVSAAFVVVVIATQWRIDRWRDRLSMIGAAIILPVAYQVFRMGYYGLLVSNTAVAKEGGRLRVDQGWRYFQNFVDPYWLWVPAALLVLGGYLPLALRSRRANEHRAVVVLGTFLGISILATAAVIGYGGDYMHGRLLLPALFALCAPVALVPANRRYLAVGVVAMWAIICLVSLRPAESRSPSGISPDLFFLPKNAVGEVTLEQRGYGPGSPTLSWYQGPELYVQPGGFSNAFRKVDLPPARDIRLPAAAVNAIGAVSYALPELFVLDRHGLADPVTGHLELEARGQPGHEKTLPPAWIAALMTAGGTRPTLAQFELPIAPTTPGGTSPFPVQVAAARHALKCPTLRGLERATRGPLNPHSFASNVFHAFGRTSMRIPSDPVAAERKFCEPRARR